MDQIITQEQNPFFEHAKPVPRKGSRVINTLQGIVIFAFVLIVVYLFIATPNQVDGRSMLPNFTSDDIVLTNRIIQWMDSSPIGKTLGLYYQRGDVVVIQTPELPTEEYIIKRIIGVPKDKVSVKDGYVYLNGKRIDETDYLPAERRTNPGSFIQEGDEVEVKDGTVLVMGDNRPESLDSRFYPLGLIQKTKLVGRVIIRIWPIGSFGLIPRGEIKSTT